MAAIKAAGSIDALARIVERDRAVVSRWKRVPAEHCLRISAALQLPLTVLRPDVYEEDTMFKSTGAPAA
jgi:YdaS antitoxin of YdaST toxin-antitoxin system